jgi:DNA replication and repair protein RecF
MRAIESRHDGVETMHVKRMKLQHFRNYENLSLDIHPQLNIFYGKNAQGKTNLLESLYLCGTGRSHRTFHEKEMIHWDYE